MPFKIVRNDITKMKTRAIVNTANEEAAVGSGCDTAIYKAAGYDELLEYRRTRIGRVPEGEVFLTPGFGLDAEYIIHAVSPVYLDGGQGEEEKLRSCYRKSLALAKEMKLESIAFPLISTGSFGYPREEGMRIAADEINAFLLENDMLIYLVVFIGEDETLGKKIYPDLESYIDDNYVEEKLPEEYPLQRSIAPANIGAVPSAKEGGRRRAGSRLPGGLRRRGREADTRDFRSTEILTFGEEYADTETCVPEGTLMGTSEACVKGFSRNMEEDIPQVGTAFEEVHESALEERMKHLSDSFSEYLLYIIKEKKMQNSEVWKRAIVDKKIFSKIKNNPDYHPKKLTALCLCVGAKLNLDETKDLLARAGYALSPCDKTDIIFSYFIENGIYDMIDLDIQLEEHGLPCIIT